MTHSYKVHFFHLIWSTRNRADIIGPDLQPRLYQYIGGIVKNLDGTLLTIGGMPNHVHLFIQLNNLDKYSSFVRDVKSHSTLWIHKNFANLQNFAWQEGFASLTVSYSTLDRVSPHSARYARFMRGFASFVATATFSKPLIFLKKRTISRRSRSCALQTLTRDHFTICKEAVAIEIH